MLDETLEDAKERMASSVSVFAEDLDGFRTNQASTALVDRMQIEVDMGGSVDTMQVNQAALVQVASTNSIMISPFFPEASKAIVKSIQQSDLGINPRVEGNAIRLTLPELNQERRTELIRLVNKRAEDARIAIRNVRRDAQSMIRDLQKEGEASEDDCKRALKTLQELTDDATENVAKLTGDKEAQIMATS